MENKNVISDPKEKATILNDFFIEQTNLDISSAALPPMNFIQTRKFLSTVITSKEEVFNLLNSVNVAKACEKSAVKLNNDLSTKWSQQWLVTMNASKTRTRTFTVKKKKSFHPTMRMNGKTIDEVFSHTHLL